jgi:hypothetical protein
MVKILIGLVTAVVIAAAAFLGFEFYAQHRITGEIEAAFEQIRATGGQASHGKVSFGLLSRTVTVADIAVASAAQPPVNFRIAGITVTGATQPDAKRFSADNIEMTDIEVGTATPIPPGSNLTYKVPRISVKGYSGPASLPRPPASTSFIDVYRFALEQFAEITVSSVTAPSLAATIDFGGAGNGSVTYSGLEIQDIRNGNIASVRVGEFTFAVHLEQAGKAQSITGDVVDIAAHDIDTAAAATILDPQKANDDQYYTVYRQIQTGAYTLASDQGVHMRIDGLSINDIGVRPSHLQLQALLAMMPPPGSGARTPAEVQALARVMMEKAADVYEGVRVGNAELRGISMDTPQGQMKLSAVWFNLEKGKIGELALEGLDAPSPKGPVKLGRFALKSVDLANLMRWSALYTNPAQQPSPEYALGMLALLQGVEIKGLVAPYKDSDKPVNIDNFDLNWGQFVGPIPSRARLIAKMTTPLDPANPALLPLITAGIDSATIDFDLGANWTEASRTFVLDPVTLELGSLLKASAQVSLGNVPRGAFSLNPTQAIAMAAQIEAGTMAITVRDLGGIDLAIAQYARSHNASPDDARRAIVNGIRAAGASSPDAVPIVEAVARFIENPRGTLTLKLTPRGKVPAMQLIQTLQTNPQGALTQFQIEASTAP